MSRIFMQRVGIRRKCRPATSKSSCCLGLLTLRRCSVIAWTAINCHVFTDPDGGGDRAARRPSWMGLPSEGDVAAHIAERLTERIAELLPLASHMSAGERPA